MMKNILHLSLPVVFILLPGLFSCKKDLSNEGSPLVNKIPVANAGFDQLIVLPQDSALLDGSKSKDPDGSIARYKWVKVAGPSSFILVNADSAKTIVRSLVEGLYQFELIVTDETGGSDRDTLQIAVSSEAHENKAPHANAGDDQYVTWSTTTVNCTLDGSASYDPDGYITFYKWRNITETLPCTIVNPSWISTMVTGLTVAVYQFELEVADNYGESSKDSVTITVYPPGTSGCSVTDRSQISATLTQIGTLSQARVPYIGAAGSKVVFAGGFVSDDGRYYIASDVVDIYDVNTHGWTTTKLSRGREGIAVVSCGNKIFFAGGGYWDIVWDNVDIYDVSTNTWTVAHLSEPRMFLTAATVGNKIYFAGGFDRNGMISHTVDIYDINTGGWGVPLTMPESDAEFSAVAVGDKIYFAGGHIYNTSANSWSTFPWPELHGAASCVAKDELIFWAGESATGTGKVEILNTSNGSVSIDCLSYGRQSPSSVIQNNDVAFFSKPTGYMGDDSGWITNQFDIYNTTTGKWSVGYLPISVASQAVIKANNTIYMAGGRINSNSGYYKCSDKVYIVTW